MRRAAHEALTKTVVQRYHPIQTKEATVLVSALLTNPKNRQKHFLRTGASTIMAILYDYPTLLTEHDKALEDVGRLIHRSSRALALGSFLVELFPWMMHIPQRSRIYP
jgi:hypothetical protein